MGQVIQGPWKKREETPAAEPSTNEYVQDDLPWYALEAPKGTKPAQYQETLASLKKLARVVRGAGGQLILPNGWYWNPAKIQSLIDQLNRISEGRVEEEEIPDEPA